VSTGRALFLIPPLDLPSHPYPAVVQLATFLRCKNPSLSVEALDLNIAFWRWALGHDALRGAKSGTELLPALAEKFRPTAPEGVTISVSLQYHGFGDPYSSQSLLDALSRHSLFDDFLEDFFSSQSLTSVEGDFPLVGISVPFPWQIEPALRVARAVKKVLPKAHVCCGGSAVGMHLFLTERREFFRYFDSMIAGDGEYPLSELLDKLDRSEDLADIPGIALLRGGAIYKNPRRSITPLDDLPAPEEIFDRRDYLGGGSGPYLRIGLSRGCSWGKCMFCNLNGCGLFPRQDANIRRALSKIRSMEGKGEKLICLTDDEASPVMLQELAERMIKEDVNVSWTAQVKFNPRMTLEWAMTLRRAGCVMLFLGLEHFNDRILKLVRKPTNRELIERCLGNIAWAGISVTAYMMLGLPTETEKEARESFEILTRFMDDGLIKTAYYNYFSIDGYSPAAKMPQNFGIGRVLWPGEGNDLSPWALGFEQQSAGMDGLGAAKLQMEFENTLASRKR
jgi:radical SAM superfamily enzyme YgiQ (UPF0313 family)